MSTKKQTPDPVAVFPRAEGEVRITPTVYREKQYVDLRFFWQRDITDPTDRIPTKKGVSIPVDELPAVIAVLQEIARGAGVEG